MRSLVIGILLIIAASGCKNSMTKTQESTAEENGRKTVVLVHGYSKDSGDMRSMAGFLEDAGYTTVNVDLPLTFEHVEDAVDVFAKEMDALFSRIPEDRSIAMVGHSTGGVVIRYYLSHYPQSSRVDCAVLIATPNRGSTLAGMAGEFSELLVETFATLDSLRPEKISKLGLADPEETRIGAIAGNKGNLVLGQLLEAENDGRIEVASVYYPGLDDFAVVPYNHHQIHHEKETADRVIRFIETGAFAP